MHRGNLSIHNWERMNEQLNEMYTREEVNEKLKALAGSIRMIIVPLATISSGGETWQEVDEKRFERDIERVLAKHIGEE